MKPIAFGVCLAVVAAILIAAIPRGQSPAALEPATGVDGDSSYLVAGYPVCASEKASSTLTGAGATFPFAFYSKLMDVYDELCDVRINYQSIGSGAGIQQITAKTVDFGASDGIMSAAQEGAATNAGGPILHIPTTLAPVAVAYNLPGIQSGQLKLTPDVLADIYLHKVRRWDDARIISLNPGLKLPKSDITVVHRSDGSGTTNIFTNYLSKVSSEWKEVVGSGNSVSWPAGIGGQGNEGVAGQIKNLPGTIGYVELAFAKQTKLSIASLNNRSGNFILPSLNSASAAAQGVTLPDDMKIVLTDSPNPDAYPITSLTWILAYQDAPDAGKGRTLAHFLWWAIHDGQQYAEALEFPMLSPDAVAKAEAQILSLRCGDEACLNR